MPITLRRKKKTAPDVEALLADANSASQHVAVLHVAFMAICAYVLVIVFGTTDMDLLIGKGIRLPVVDVEVPIVGFYAAAPYLLVLVHLNLLLQLQLLSRKLYAFSEAAPEHEGLGGLRDRLHIFPYNYYLVGRPDQLVQALLGLLVPITLIVLPLASLFALQIGFLAYQSEAITWAQRFAIWLDITLVILLWPTIIHPRDSRRDYWHEMIAAHFPSRKSWLVLLLLIPGLLLFLFSVPNALVTSGLALLMLSPMAMMHLGNDPQLLRQRIAGAVLAMIAILLAISLVISKDLFVLIVLALFFLAPVVIFGQPKAPRGSLVLLLMLYICPLLPLALLVDGEKLETFVVSTIQGGSTDSLPPDTTFISKLFTEQRQLDLNEQILLARQPSPEILADIRSDVWISAVNKVEPIKLTGRSLHHAQMNKAIILGVDLRGAQMRGANLQNAQLQGANLGGAQLQGANLRSARLQGADLNDAQLQGATLLLTKLQGTKLRGAQLQGADLRSARLQGADLDNARLQGANLSLALLHGAKLDSAWLHGANLSSAELQGADLDNTQLQGANLRNTSFYNLRINPQAQLVDIREMKWVPLQANEHAEAKAQLNFIRDKEDREPTMARLNEATKPMLPMPKLKSCLAKKGGPADCEVLFDDNKLVDKNRYIKELHDSLAHLACESPDIARGLIGQIQEDDKDKQSTRTDLQDVLIKRLADPKCPGMYELRADEKTALCKRATTAAQQPASSYCQN